MGISDAFIYLINLCAEERDYEGVIGIWIAPYHRVHLWALLRLAHSMEPAQMEVGPLNCGTYNSIET